MPRSLPPIYEHHLLFAGHLQNRGEMVGQVYLWRHLHHLLAGSDTTVELHPWHADVEPIAELIWRTRPEECLPDVYLYGYSWGGMTAVNLAGALHARGIGGIQMVLSDPVYRHRYWLGNWRTLLRTTIWVPQNVTDVWSFFQLQNWPSGHPVKAIHPECTTVHKPRELHVRHAYMDDHDTYHCMAERVARGLV